MGGGRWGVSMLDRAGEWAAPTPILGGNESCESDSSDEEAMPPWMEGRPEAEGELEELFSEASKPFERWADEAFPRGP
eukprot:scaffold36218_cov39-Isochrysis_galbana.AAC.1